MKVLRVVLWFAGIGLLPLWVSMGVVIAGSYKPSAGSEYWAVAPWLVILGAMYCWISLIVAAVTYIVYTRTAGSTSRRYTMATAVFVLSSALGATWAWAPWHKRRIVDSQYQQENAQGATFVQKHQLTTALLGNTVRVSLSQSTVPEDPRADRELVYFAYMPEKITDGRMAIVRLSRVNNNSVYTLRCIATQFAFQNREFQSDACHPKFSASHPPPTEHEVFLADERP
jgi:hypothetical protein